MLSIGQISRARAPRPITMVGQACPGHLTFRATLPQVNLGTGLWHHLSMPKIHIPTPLRQYAGKQPAVEVQGANVGEALSSLVSQHPDLRRHLYTDEGKLRAFVNVYLNDEDVRYLQKEAT